MSSKESVNRAHRIKAEQEQLVAALSDDDLFKQLWRKVLDVFTHKAKPSTLSIPVDHERDDDCYVALRLNQLRDRLRAASNENKVFRDHFKDSGFTDDELNAWVASDSGRESS